MDDPRLAEKRSRYEELERLFADPAVLDDKERYQQLAKEFSSLGELMTEVRRVDELTAQVEQLRALLSEPHEKDLKDLAQEELEDTEKELADARERLAQLLTPARKSVGDRDVIMEIRAGTGGQEASLFAADLYRMYTKYAERRQWKVESISSHPSETGGFKEVIFSIRGPGAAEHLQFESGAHRVQRIPTTEASGRIHTSAATVAVLFEPEEVEVQIDPKDLKVDVFRSSGPGGQSVNTTDSAIRITHLPTGLVVVCQDERSQLKNKMKAMRVLRARLHERARQEQAAKTTQDRKLKVGSGDRSEKIRTYNFPERRVTDHRIGLTLYKLPAILDGDLDELTGALIKADQEAEEASSR